LRAPPWATGSSLRLACRVSARIEVEPCPPSEFCQQGERFSLINLCGCTLPATSRKGYSHRWRDRRTDTVHNNAAPHETTRALQGLFLDGRCDRSWRLGTGEAPEHG